MESQSVEPCHLWTNQNGSSVSGHWLEGVEGEVGAAEGPGQDRGRESEWDSQR